MVTTTDFITVADKAKEEGCIVRTILDRVSRGVYPPFLGNQSGLRNDMRGWNRTYWESWHAERGRIEARAVIPGSR